MTNIEHIARQRREREKRERETDEATKPVLERERRDPTLLAVLKGERETRRRERDQLIARKKRGHIWHTGKVTEAENGGRREKATHTQRERETAMKRMCAYSSV